MSKTGDESLRQLQSSTIKPWGWSVMEDIQLKFHFPSTATCLPHQRRETTSEIPYWLEFRRKKKSNPVYREFRYSEQKSLKWTQGVNFINPMTLNHLWSFKLLTCLPHHSKVLTFKSNVMPINLGQIATVLHPINASLLFCKMRKLYYSSAKNTIPLI